MLVEWIAQPQHDDADREANCGKGIGMAMGFPRSSSTLDVDCIKSPLSVLNVKFSSCMLAPDTPIFVFLLVFTRETRFHFFKLPIRWPPFVLRKFEESAARTLSSFEVPFLYEFVL